MQARIELSPPARTGSATPTGKGGLGDQMPLTGSYRCPFRVIMPAAVTTNQDRWSSPCTVPLNGPRWSRAGHDGLADFFETGSCNWPSPSGSIRRSPVNRSEISSLSYGGLRVCLRAWCQCGEFTLEQLPVFRANRFALNSDG